MKTLDDVIKYLDDSIAFMESLIEPAQREAADLFPHHPKAQEIWIKLRSGNGGIEEVVEVLGLHADFDNYSKQFYRHIRNGNGEAASICVDHFKGFCIEQLRENFYLFE